MRASSTEGWKVLIDMSAAQANLTSTEKMAAQAAAATTDNRLH